MGGFQIAGTKERVVGFELLNGRRRAREIGDVVRSQSERLRLLTQETDCVRSEREGRKKTDEG